MNKKNILKLAVLVTIAGSVAVDGRVFTGQGGKQLDGTLLKFDGTNAKIQRNSDGKIITIPFSRLSKADQDFLQQVKKKGNPAKTVKIPRQQVNRLQETVNKTPRGEILTISRKIDQLLEDGYKKHGVKALPVANDETFLRRTYLDIAGRIPTYQETTSFLRDTSTNKRGALVDNLLDSEGYNSHAYTFWADILRLKDRFGGGNYGSPIAYIKWVKQAIRDNVPYDKFVHQLLTSEGFSWDNGAVGYYMRDSGMPLDNMSNTVQVFLGTQMVCAQCHNHPFDKWTQMDYYQLAAFTYGAHTRINSQLKGRAQNLMRQEFAAKIKKEGKPSKQQAKKYENDLRKKFGRASSEIFKPIAYGVQEMHNRHLQLPHDYQYSDAKPKQKVTPGTIFGDEIDLENFETRRESYVEWMTSPQNPRFTKIIANRLWKRAMGRGLIEPVDDIRDDTESANPQLSAYLEKQLIALGYDMKQFLRAIYNSRAYQGEGFSGELSVVDKYPFQGPIVKRISAEQIWDSYVTLSLPNPDHRLASFKSADSKLAAYNRYEKILNSKSPEQVVDMIKEGAKLEARTNDEMRVIQEKILKAQDKEDFTLVKDLKREYSMKRRERESNYMLLATGGIDVMKSNGSSAKGMMFYNRMEPDRNESAHWKGFNRNLLRASELPNPAPAGHFLRQFGQSDRELIENASDDASIPQVLTLLNGRHLYEIVRPQAPLTLSIREKETPKEKIRVIYLSILNRLPDADEMAICMEVVNKHPNLTRVKYDPKKSRNLSKSYLASPWTDIVWAVLNTQEFLFRL